jgi:uncharacterized protein (TIGR00369 family)
MTGRAYVQAIADGEAEAPPMAQLVGMRLLTVGDGEVVVACDAEERFYNPLGVVHGGLLCTLLDTAMGLATTTTLPAGTGFGTIEIKVSFLKAVRADDGELRAVGRVVKRGRRVTFAEGEVRNAAGDLVGSATSSLLIAGT